MKRLQSLCLAALLILAAVGSTAAADKFNYITPAELKGKIEQKSPVHLLDIQVQEGFCEHHIPGAIATYAYPVKTAEDRARLDAFLGAAKGDNAPIVIVCPRGGGGAERAYDHLAAQGIDRSRLLILEKGQEGWPYPEMIEKTN